MGTIVLATCKQLHFGVRLVYGGGGLGLDGGTRSRVWVGRVMWVHGYSGYSLRFNLAIFTIYVHNYSLCIYNYKLMYTYTCNIQYFRCNLYKLRRHNSTHAPTSPSLVNTHEISYPHSTPTPLHHTQDARQSVAAYKFCCQSVNLKMAIRAETCSWYLCNKQHISNHQIVVFDSWLIQL